MTRRERAIKYCIEARLVHIAWAKYASKTRRHNAIAGNTTHHRMWIKRYDAIIRELES